MSKGLLRRVVDTNPSEPTYCWHWLWLLNEIDENATQRRLGVLAIVTSKSHWEV